MPPSPLTPVKPLVPPAPAAPPGRAFDDVDAYRTNLYDGVLKSVVAAPPVTVGNFSLGLSDVSYADPPDVTAKERKQAILRNETLARRLRGTLTLTDLTTNAPVATKPITIARVPKPTADGTMVLNGVEWTLGNQLRLRPGVFVRKTHAGDVEAHVNVAPGTGSSHHYAIDPTTKVFKVRVGQSNIPLAPLLRRMGATDADFAGAWGAEIAHANKRAPAPDAMKKLYARVVRRAASAGPDADPDGSVVAAFRAMAFEPDVTKRTLGTPHANIGAGSILAATKKILAVRKGEADPDDRDAMVYQSLLGPEDLIAERTRLMPKALRQIAFKAAMRKSLDHAPADFFGPYLRAAITDSGLGQPLDEVNPIETLGQMTRVSRLGVGGISSAVSNSAIYTIYTKAWGFIS